MTQATNYLNKTQQYANLYPEATVNENPRFAEIWVRQSKGTYIDRCVALPEMDADHPVRMNMERWGFVLVARIYAKSVKVLTYKGFYKTRDAEASTETPKENGTIVSHLFGEDIQPDNGEADTIMLNMFCFKGFDSLPSKDDKGNYIKDQDGKFVYVNVGHINSVSFYPIQDKVATERMIAYKNCAMPCSVVIGGLEKIQILKSRSGGIFTVKGQFLYESKLKIEKYMDSINNKPITSKENSVDTFYEEVSSTPNVTADLAASGQDDLPF